MNYLQCDIACKPAVLLGGECWKDNTGILLMDWDTMGGWWLTIVCHTRAGFLWREAPKVRDNSETRRKKESREVRGRKKIEQEFLSHRLAFSFSVASEEVTGSMCYLSRSARSATERLWSRRFQQISNNFFKLCFSSHERGCIFSLAARFGLLLHTRKGSVWNAKRSPSTKEGWTQSKELASVRWGSCAQPQPLKYHRLFVTIRRHSFRWNYTQ